MPPPSVVTPPARFSTEVADAPGRLLALKVTAAPEAGVTLNAPLPLNVSWVVAPATAVFPRLTPPLMARVRPVPTVTRLAVAALSVWLRRPVKVALAELRSKAPVVVISVPLPNKSEPPATVGVLA